MSVQNLPDLCRKIREVAAVQPDAVPVRIIVVNAVFPECPDGIEDTAAEGVIRVNEKNQIFSAVCLDIVVERLVFTLHADSVGCHETVGHGSCGRNTVQYACEDIRCARAAGNDRCLGPIHCRPRAVRSSGAEFAYRM